MEVTVRTHVGNRGWALDAIEVTEASDVVHPWRASIDGRPATLSSDAGGTVSVHPDSPTSFPVDFRIERADNRALITDAADAITTKWADAFIAMNSGPVRYRLYSPSAGTPRPLILFLHGGGEAGTDNWAQMVGTFGAAHLAEERPDFFVLAPQAPPGTDPLPPAQRPFAESRLDPHTGWHQHYLADVCAVIRRMIANDKVDASRVYLTGVSMGGAGAIRALSVDTDLFAAAAPVCPTMTPETFGILRTHLQTPLWVSSAYIDHTPHRHKYLVDAVQELVLNGSPHARLTLFSPEQMNAYGFATDPDATYQELLLENHHAWVPAYHDEDGILTWLTSQSKTPSPLRSTKP